MNEKDFLREILDKTNGDGRFTPSIIQELLYSYRRLVLTGKNNIFTRLFSKFKKEKTATEIVEDNFELVLDRTNDDQLTVLIETLMANDETAEIVKRKFDFIINRFVDTPTGMECNIESAYMLGIARTAFFAKISKLPDGKEILISHIDAILQDGFQLEDAKILKGLTEDIDNKLEAKLENEIDQIAADLLSRKCFRYSRDKKLLDDYTDTVAIMIKELLKSEKTKILDIESIGTGTYSSAYQIGEKVLKLGRTRETYQIPNHRRILQPLTRINLLDEEDGNKPKACLEIQELTDKIPKEEMDKEKLYQLYKELRDDGIVWTDVDFRNVGKLRKKNVPTLNGEEMDVSPNSVGLSEKVKGEELSVGDWVVIDTDYIYRENDKGIEGSESSYWIEFEVRWQSENPEKCKKSNILNRNKGSYKKYNKMPKENSDGKTIPYSQHEYDEER